MKKTAILVILAALAVPAMAAPTLFDSVVDLNVELLAKPNNPVVSHTWNHAVPDEAIGYITAATLKIDYAGFESEDDNVSVWLEGYSLGILTGSKANGSTTFSITGSALTAIDNLTATTATITFTTAGPGNGNDNIKLSKSTLHIEYDAPGGDVESPSPAVVPAPGAILLGAMGTSLVGWLRRRRSL